jgi:uncharacterized protein YfaP (DUF2135 family)
MSDLRKILLSPFAIVLAISIALVAVMTIASRSDGSAEVDIPVSLTGKWHQTEGPKNVRMTAEIYGGSIQIDMESREATYPYWLGTFDSDRNTRKPFKVVSIGDPDAMSQSIFGSNEKTKPFTYKDGLISFEFSMFHGQQRVTVKLEKDKPAPKPKVTHTVDIPGMGRVYTPLPRHTSKVVKPPSKPNPRVQATVYKTPTITKK